MQTKTIALQEGIGAFRCYKDGLRFNFIATVLPTYGVARAFVINLVAVRILAKN